MQGNFERKQGTEKAFVDTSYGTGTSCETEEHYVQNFFWNKTNLYEI